MTLNILNNVMKESIIATATFELREWEFIDLSLVEMEFEYGAMECTGRISRCLKEIKESFNLFEDPEFSFVQYKPFVEKLNTEIHEYYKKLLTYDFEDYGGNAVIVDNKPTDYSSLVKKVEDEYVEIRNVFRDGSTISDFRKIEGFDPDITPYLARVANRSSKDKNEFLTNCTLRVWEQNAEVFGAIEPYFYKIYPDFKHRVCEAVFERFKDNPDLIQLESED